MKTVLLLLGIFGFAQLIAGQGCDNLKTFDTYLEPACSPNDIHVRWPNYQNQYTYFACNGVGKYTLVNCPSGQVFTYVFQQCGPCSDYIPPVECVNLKTQESPSCVSADTTDTSTATVPVSTGTPTPTPTVTVPISTGTPTPTPTVTVPISTGTPTPTPTVTVPISTGTPTVTVPITTGTPTVPTPSTSDDLPVPPSPHPTNPPGVPEPSTPLPTPPNVSVAPPVYPTPSNANN